MAAVAVNEASCLCKLISSGENQPTKPDQQQRPPLSSLLLRNGVIVVDVAADVVLVSAGAVSAINELQFRRKGRCHSDLQLHLTGFGEQKKVGGHATRSCQLSRVVPVAVLVLLQLVPALQAMELVQLERATGLRRARVQ